MLLILWPLFCQPSVDQRLILSLKGHLPVNLRLCTAVDFHVPLAIVVDGLHTPTSIGTMEEQNEGLLEVLVLQSPAGLV